MAFRFRKSIRIAKGVRLNLGSKSVGVSAGVKGLRVSTNSRTGTRARELASRRVFQAQEFQIRRKSGAARQPRDEHNQLGLLSQFRLFLCIQLKI